MDFRRSARRAGCALVGLVAVSGAPAHAADDKSTISSVMELVGVSADTSASKIDYSERPKLVLPPRADLPAPREDAGRPDGWPTDAASARRRNSDRYAHVPNAPPEEHKPGLLESALTAGTTTTAAHSPVLDEPSRRVLTEPPSGYRRPTKELSKIVDPDAKKGSWWNPMSYLGGGGDPGASGAGVAPAAPQRTASGSGTGGGMFSGVMPTFLRGSDN